MPAPGGKLFANMIGMGGIVDRYRNQEENLRAERHVRSTQGQTSPFAQWGPSKLLEPESYKVLNRTDPYNNWQYPRPNHQGPSNPVWFRPHGAPPRSQAPWAGAMPDFSDRLDRRRLPPARYLDLPRRSRLRRQHLGRLEEDPTELRNGTDLSNISDISDDDEDHEEYDATGSDEDSASWTRRRSRNDPYSRRYLDRDDQRRQMRHRRDAEEEDETMYERHGGMPRVHGQYPRDRFRTGYDRGSPYDTIGS